MEAFSRNTARSSTRLSAREPLAPAQLAQGHAVAIERGPDEPAAQRLPPPLLC